MSTTEVTTWVTDISQLGPIYPMVGTEMILYIAGLAFWLGFHVLQGRIEARELQEESESLSKGDRLGKMLKARLPK